MRVTVQLYARLREIAGASSFAVEVADEATVADVWQAVLRRAPDLEPFGSTVSAAVNTDFAKRTSAVRAGDEIAFLPPVSGGATLR